MIINEFPPTRESPMVHSKVTQATIFQCVRLSNSLQTPTNKGVLKHCDNQKNLPHKFLKCPLAAGTSSEGNHCYINATKKKIKISCLGNTWMGTSLFLLA